MRADEKLTALLELEAIVSRQVGGPGGIMGGPGGMPPFASYTNFGTASHFGPLLPFVKRNKSNFLVNNGKVADNLKKAGWSLGWVSAIVRADEKLTAFAELI